MLIESNDGITHTNHYDNDQNEALSHKDEKLGCLKNDITSTNEIQDNKSLTSVLLDVDDASHKSNHLHFADSSSPSFSSSSDNSSSSSSTSESFIVDDYSSIETEDLSKIDRKHNKTSKKYSDKKTSGNNSKLTSDKVCYQAL